MEGVYNDKMMFSDLVQTEGGFKFNMTTVTHELVYHLDERGERTSIAKDYTGTSVFCYELALRKSTGRLTGYMHWHFNNSSASDYGSCCLRTI